MIETRNLELQRGKYGSKEMTLFLKIVQLASFVSWKRNIRTECCNQALRMKDASGIPFLVWVNSPL
jgi:hypothetical protein